MILESETAICLSKGTYVKIEELNQIPGAPVYLLHGMSIQASAILLVAHPSPIAKSVQRP